MDKRQTITFISLTAAIFAIWIAADAWYAKHHPVVPSPAVVATTQPAPLIASSSTPTTGPAGTQPATFPVPTQTMTAATHPVPSTQSSAALLGSAAKKDPTYAIQVALTSQGAGIEAVTLNSFPGPNNERLKEDQKQPYRFQTPIANHDNTQALATRWITIDGAAIDLAGVPWTKVSSDLASATYSIDIDDPSGHLAEITKTYHIDTRAAADGSQGYEVSIEQKVRNLRPGKAIAVKASLNGPTPPPAEVEPGSDRAIVVGYKGTGQDIGVTQHVFADFKSESPTKDLTLDGDKHHVAWAGQMSTYFSAVVLPDDYEKPQYNIHAEALDPAAEVERNVALTFETPEVQVAAGQEAAFPKLTAYFGPKWRAVLGTAHYSDFPRKYEQILVIRGGFCGFCTFTPLIKALVGILWFFHAIFRDWGLAIICLVLCVRTLLHPITKRSQVQMMRMGKLSPEVEKLKKKYADQPDVLNREMMKLYKQQSGAILGCLPMFLQTPIWIALWAALQSTFELRQEPFFYGFTWIKDLAKPDTLVNITALLGHPIPLLFGWQIRAINILPLAMAVVTYINMKYFTPMPPATTPEQESQQKMQRGMSVFFPLMFYSFPSGLNIYYLTTTTLGIVESKIIRKHIKEREEAELAGRVIVTTKPTRGSRRKDDFATDEAAKNAKPGMMARMMDVMAKAQQRAEEIRKDSQKKNPKDGR